MASFSDCAYLYEWPESERLKKALSADPPKLDHYFTMPGVKSNSAMDDNMASSALQLLNVTVSRPTVSSDYEGLKQLIDAGHLRAAVNLSTNILTGLHQGVGMAGRPSINTLESFEVWACRFQLLMALKMYSLLNDELLAFEELDAPDLYFQYYPNVFNNRKGSLIPFSLRLVHAEALRFTPYPWATIKRTAVLKENVLKVIAILTERQSPSEHILAWKRRLLAVEKVRARTLFFLKEYCSSITLYNRLCAQETDDAKRHAIKLMLMRMAVSVGDEKKMELYLKEASFAPLSDLQLHKSLKSVFYGSYVQAQEHLQKVAKPTEENAEAWNNAAVCMLYGGRVNDAINTLRSYRGTPNEPITVNFVTITELSTFDVSKQKLWLFRMNVDHFPDMFDPVALKLST